MKTFINYISENINDPKKTLDFIKKAHAGQKYGNDPYWKHPKAVADAGKKFFGSKFDKDAYIAALLHDVIEDTPYKETELKNMGYTDAIIKSVKLLTKDKSMSYFDNIARIISSGDKRAMMVKYADNYVNFTGDKSSWTPEKRAASQSKYKKSILTIGDKLGIKSQLPEGYEWMAKRYMKSLNMLGEALGVKSDWLLEDSQLYIESDDLQEATDIVDLDSVVGKMKRYSHDKDSFGFVDKNSELSVPHKSVHDQLKKYGYRYYEKRQGKIRKNEPGMTHFYKKRADANTDYYLYINADKDGKVWNITHNITRY